MTAELAVVLPVVVAVIAVGVGALHVGADQLRLADAAAGAARSLARGDSPATAEHVAGLLGPAADLRVRQRGEVVCVQLSARLPLAGPVTVPGQASGCALGGPA